MKYTGKPRRTASKPAPDPAAKLRDQAIRGRDKGDGRGTDWVMAASDALLAAYHCLDRAAGDPRLPSLLEHAHGTIYNRWMGNPDDGLAAPVQPRDSSISTQPGPNPDPYPSRR